MKFEQMSLKKNFWRFIGPSIIAQWIFALYTMVDGMFVARGVSEIALSAVNIASPFANFMFSVSILFAVGTSTMVSICLGQGKKQEANRIYTQNIIVLTVVSMGIMLFVWLRIDQIALFLGANEMTQEYVKYYILSMVPFTLFFILSYSFEILVKTDGYPKFATAVVATGAILNCILDYLFVMVFHWGVQGAGVATGISQLMVVILYLVHFLSPRATIRFVKPVWRMQDMMRGIKIGLASGLTEFSAGITIFLFNHALLTHIGGDAIISYTVVAYVNTIVVMSMVGIAQGIQPLISYYYGKGEPAQYHKLLRYAVWAAMGISVFAFASAWMGADWIVGLFISKELTALREYSVHVFRIFSISFLLVGYNVIASGFFTAIERPKSALAISVGRGLITVVAALEICIWFVGGRGIWWAPTLSELLCLGITAVMIWSWHKSTT